MPPVPRAPQPSGPRHHPPCWGSSPMFTLPGSAAGRSRCTGTRPWFSCASASTIQGRPAFGGRACIRPGSLSLPLATARLGAMPVPTHPWHGLGGGCCCRRRAQLGRRGRSPSVTTPGRQTLSNPPVLCGRAPVGPSPAIRLGIRVDSSLHSLP